MSYYAFCVFVVCDGCVWFVMCCLSFVCCWLFVGLSCCRCVDVLGYRFLFCGFAIVWCVVVVWFCCFVVAWLCCSVVWLCSCVVILLCVGVLCL